MENSQYIIGHSNKKSYTVEYEKIPCYLQWFGGLLFLELVSWVSYSNVCFLLLELYGCPCRLGVYPWYNFAKDVFSYLFMKLRFHIMSFNFTVLSNFLYRTPFHVLHINLGGSFIWRSYKRPWIKHAIEVWTTYWKIKLMEFKTQCQVLPLLKIY